MTIANIVFVEITKNIINLIKLIKEINDKMVYYRNSKQFLKFFQMCL